MNESSQQQHRRPLCCSLPHRDELEVGVQFWERLDNAVRISMACAFTGTIIFFTNQSVFANGFLAVVVLLALEPAEQTVGGCLQTIPMIYRGCALGILLGVISVVAIFQPLSAIDGDGGRLAVHIMYPIVVAAMGFIIVIWQWIPSPCKGVGGVVAILTLPSAVNDLSFSWKFLLSFCFGISTSVVFKLLPLPTTSAVSTLSKSSSPSTSSSCGTVVSKEGRIHRKTTQNCCYKFIIRSVFALPKIKASIKEGRRLSAAIIAMLADVAIAEARQPRQTGFDDTDAQDDDGIVARRNVLASIRVAIQKLENEIIPQIQGGMQDAKVEILLLLIAPRSEVQTLDNSLQLFHTIVPTLKFLEDIVLVNHYEDEMRADIVHELKDYPLNLRESFTRYIETPLRALTKALYMDIVEGNTSKETKMDEINHVRRAHRQLLTAVQNHRFDIFYRPRKVVNDDPAFSREADAARWGFFARGLSFVQGMGRLVCAVENGRIQERELPSDKKTDGLPNSSASHSFSNWLRDFASVFFAGVHWSRPFSIDRENIRYALNFAVQVGLSSLWFAIPVLNDRLDNEGIFVAVTTCFISTGKFGLSFQKSVQRILATAIASIYVLFVVVTLDLSANQALNATYLYILLCLLLIDRKNPYTMDCAAFTAVILLSKLDPSDTENESQELYVLVVNRIASVGIGVIQFIVIEMFFFYDSARTRIEEQSRIHVRYIADAVDGIAAFVSRLDIDGKDEGDDEGDNDGNNDAEEISNQSESLELIRTAIGLCEDSTAAAVADITAAKQEPEPKIDIKSPFEFVCYSKLLSVQSNINTILSQILGCCEAVTKTPERDTTKPVYKYEVKMLVEMFDSVRGPFERLRTDYENRADDKVWLRDLRRFKKSTIKSIGFRSFDLIRSHSITLKAKDPAVMVDQSFILQWIAISRCLLQLCHEVSKASVCFEDIISSHPNFCAIERLPVPSSTTEDTMTTTQDSNQNQGLGEEDDDGDEGDIDIEQQQQQQELRYDNSMQ
mmetsp:Transcript_8613/g.21575  ORF Transcript_8613/g.21575 Transcript_8613/m.21575 type:complete len:1012 (-) Transcript_8613:108-3143(-)